VGDRELTEAVHASIRARMQEQGVSVRALAERLGMGHTTLRHRLEGAGNFDLDHYEALAHALGARDVEELLADARRGL